MKIIVATGNKNKIKEFRSILPEVDFVSAAEAGCSADAVENGKTFEENALIKARDIYKKIGLPTVADDSGLEVNCLGGRPGVYSARYYGEETDYTRKNNFIINEVNAVDGDRSAQFVCVIAYIDQSGIEYTFRGECEGEIADRIKGQGGFGYDPIFYRKELGKTFGELSQSEKDSLSHRGEALKKFSAMLKAQR